MPPYARRYVKANRGRYITKNRAMARSRSRRYRGMGRAGFTEKKYYDFASSEFYPPLNSAANTWQTYGAKYNPTGTATKLLFAPEQGVKLFQRIGRRCWINDLKVNFQIEFDQSWTNQSIWEDAITSFKIVILIDKHVDLQAWDSTDVSSVMASDVGDNEAFPQGLNNLSFTNTTTWGRYRVLKQLTFKRQNIDEASNYNGNAYSVIHKKWKHTFKRPIQVNFSGDGGSGDEGNVSDIGLRMIVVGVNKDGETPNDRLVSGVKFDYFGRVGFYDHK